MWHIPHRLALQSCVPAAPLGTAASAHGEARCQPHGGSRVVGVGGSAGQGTGYPGSCHLWVVTTCSVTNRRLGGLGTGLLPALLMHRIAAGNGLKLPAVVWAAQAGSASGGKLRLGFVFSCLPCIWCGRGVSFLTMALTVQLLRANLSQHSGLVQVKHYQDTKQLQLSYKHAGKAQLVP